MMKRNLAGRARDGLIGLVALGSAYACGKDIVKPPVDYAPESTIQSISPTSGMSPLSVQARYECSDDNGIKEYRIINGSQTTTSSTPIDALVTFTESGNIKLECEDTGGQTASYGPINIDVTQPPQPSYSQTAEVNGVDITSNVTLTNLEEASLAYHKENGDIMATRTITTPTYNETFTDAFKGDNYFVLSAPGLAPDTIIGSVTDYASEAPDLSGLDLDLDEGSSLVAHLKRATDKNTADNPVRYTGVTSSGVVGASLGTFPNDTVMTIDASQISGPDPVPYSIELSREGSSEKINLEGRILDVPEPPPTGDQIAFAGSDNIWIVNENGSGLEQLTSGSQNLEPAFSPDGRYLAFHTNRNGIHEIYTRNMSDGSLFRLTEGIESSTQPAFSPDGEKVAFRYRQGNLVGIGLIDLDGTNFTRIIEEVGGTSGGPSWSPDGTKIAFYTFRDGNWEIYTSNADGTNQTNITNSPAYDVSPDWSPDGSKIIYVSDPDQTDEFYELEIYKINPDGSNRIQLTDDSSKDLDPSWSPDGTKIVFGRRESPVTTQDIWTMNADGTNQRKIFESPSSHERDPVFRPKR